MIIKRSPLRISLGGGGFLMFYAGGLDPAVRQKATHPGNASHCYGLGILRAESLASWPDNEPFDLADVYRRLLSENQLSGHEVTERFYEIGSTEGLAELDAFLRRRPAVSP